MYESIQPFSRGISEKSPKEQAVCDYISGMTDQYSMEKFREIYIPKSWEVY